VRCQVLGVRCQKSATIASLRSFLLTPGTSHLTPESAARQRARFRGVAGRLGTLAERAVLYASTQCTLIAYTRQPKRRVPRTSSASPTLPAARRVFAAVPTGLSVRGGMTCIGSTPKACPDHRPIEGYGGSWETGMRTTGQTLFFCELARSRQDVAITCRAGGAYLTPGSACPGFLARRAFYPLEIVRGSSRASGVRCQVSGVRPKLGLVDRPLQLLFLTPDTSHLSPETLPWMAGGEGGHAFSFSCLRLIGNAGHPPRGLLPILSAPRRKEVGMKHSL